MVLSSFIKRYSTNRIDCIRFIRAASVWQPAWYSVNSQCGCLLCLTSGILPAYIVQCAGRKSLWLNHRTSGHRRWWNVGGCEPFAQPGVRAETQAIAANIQALYYHATIYTRTLHQMCSETDLVPNEADKCARKCQGYPTFAVMQL